MLKKILILIFLFIANLSNSMNLLNSNAFTQFVKNSLERKLEDEIKKELPDSLEPVQSLVLKYLECDFPNYEFVKKLQPNENVPYADFNDSDYICTQMRNTNLLLFYNKTLPTNNYIIYNPKGTVEVKKHTETKPYPMVCEISNVYLNKVFTNFLAINFYYISENCIAFFNGFHLIFRDLNTSKTHIMKLDGPVDKIQFSKDKSLLLITLNNQEKERRLFKKKIFDVQH